MTEPSARFSDREEQFERLGRRTGFVAVPLVFALLICVPVSSDLTWRAQQLLAVVPVVVLVIYLNRVCPAETGLPGDNGHGFGWDFASKRLGGGSRGPSLPSPRTIRTITLAYI